MTAKTEFSLHEAVVLLDGYLEGTNNRESKSQTAKRMSDALRAMAVNASMTICDSYRSVRGITNRLLCMECAFNGTTDCNVYIPDLFQRVVDMYNHDHAQYQHILIEAKAMISIQTSRADKFIAWTKQNVPDKKTGWLESNLMRIESFCHKCKLFVGSIYDVADVETLIKIRTEINRNRIFQLSCGKLYQNIVADLALYCRYCAETGANTQEKPDEPQPAVLHKNAFTLADVPDLTYSKPLAFVYANGLHDIVKDWSKLYVAVLCKLSNKQIEHLQKRYFGEDFFTDASGLRYPYALRTGIYVERNFSSINLIKKLKKFFECCDIATDSLVIEFEYIKTVEPMPPQKELKEKNVSSALRTAIIRKYPVGLRFDDTVLRLLSEETRIRINNAVVESLCKEMFKRTDELFFLPEMIAPKSFIADIESVLQENLNSYALCEIAVLYKAFQLGTKTVCLRNAEDYANFLEYLLPDSVRVGTVYGIKIVRNVGVTVNEATSKLTKQLVEAIKGGGCVTEEDLLLACPVISGVFLKKMLEKNTDEVVVTKINDILCYQTIESMGFDENFSDMLSAVINKADKLSLAPTLETIHVLLSVEIGQNFGEAYSIPDDKTFRRIVSMYYSGEKLRIWKAGSFMEEQNENV